MIPAACAAARLAANPSRTVASTASGASCGCVRHASGQPRECDSATPAPNSAQTCAMPGPQVKPLTSLTISAPARSAARAVAALYVSTETTACGNAFNSPSRTGNSRACSSSALTSALMPSVWPPAREPGRVLSAPRSRMSAPSSRHCMQRTTAASGSRKEPPSEKESGVIFTTPITSVRRPNSRVRVRSRQCAIVRIGSHFRWYAAAIPP